MNAIISDLTILDAVIIFIVSIGSGIVVGYGIATNK